MESLKTSKKGKVGRGNLGNSGHFLLFDVLVESQFSYKQLSGLEHVGASPVCDLLESLL